MFSISEKEIFWSIICGLSALCTFFIKREYSNYEKKQTKQEEEDNSINGKLLEMTLLLTDVQGKVENFGKIVEEIEAIKNKLEKMEKEGNSTRHEIELLSQMIKPLFEIKKDLSRTQQDVGNLYGKTDKLQSFIHDLQKEILLIKESKKEPTK